MPCPGEPAPAGGTGGPPAPGHAAVVGHQQFEGQGLQRIAGQQGLGLAKATCTVGLPRRSTSLSMQGMSSWTSE
jgi:hypothetical protein